MNEASLPDEPTLGATRTAMLKGLTARLIGDGARTPRCSARSIRRHGEDVSAGTFVRIE